MLHIPHFAKNMENSTEIPSVQYVYVTSSSLWIVVICRYLQIFIVGFPQKEMFRNSSIATLLQAQRPVLTSASQRVGHPDVALFRLDLLDGHLQ